MKTSFLATSMFFALTATSPAALATTNVRGTVTQDTILNDLNVKSIEESAIPELRAYEVAGRVMIGGNRCGAKGVQAQLIQEVEGETIHVHAVLLVDPGQRARICTREFDPQFADVRLEVRYDMGDINQVIIKDVDERGRDVNLEDALINAVETEVSQVLAEVTNGGINPDAFAYTLTATVMVGSNSCHAAGVNVDFKQRRVGDVLEVAAVRTSSRDALQRVCPAVYMPVFKTVKTTVRGLASTTPKIIVKHVDEMENNVEIGSLL